MRKLLIILIVLVFNISTAQKQTRRIYNRVLLTTNDEKKWSDAENIFFFNYGNEAILKIYFNNGAIKTYNQVSEIEEGETEDNLKYEGAEFEDTKDSKSRFYLQIFLDEKYGCRMLFSDGTIQYIN